VPAEVLAKEREILAEQTKGEGKPPGDHRQDGRGPAAQVAGNEITLLGQPFVKDPDRPSRSC
jgi:elongation factor Ts